MLAINIITGHGLSNKAHHAKEDQVDAVLVVLLQFCLLAWYVISYMVESCSNTHQH